MVDKPRRKGAIMQKSQKTDDLSRSPNRTMLRRTLFLMAVCGILAFLALAARLYILQIRDHEKYEELAISQQLRETGASASRGTIYDRNKNVLAMSANVENVYLSPAEIKMYGEDPQFIAKNLAEILELDYESVLKKTEKTGSWYVTVAKKLEPELADKVRQFKKDNNLKGVRLESDTKRYYPYSSLACHVIGFVGTDNIGLDGVEAQYNSALCGTDGKYMRATNAYGTDLLFNQFEGYYGAKNGCDVVTTIDMSIQHYVEKNLKQAVKDYDIKNGAGAIVMDVKTGKILAMASLGGDDLNNFLDVSDEAKSVIDKASTEEEKNQLLADAQRLQWRNKTLSDTYEPGSTFKIITLSMALEEGAVSLNDSFGCGGSVQVQGRTSPVRCWKTTGHGGQTLTQAVQHSCNVAFVNIGMRVGAEKFYKYCDAFGFLNLTDDSSEQLTAKTGIDLGGESGSIWWSKDVFCSEKNKSQLAAASFGQTFTITPLQLITAVSACVNGGHSQQIRNEQCVKRAGVRTRREHLADVQKQHLGVLGGCHADTQRFPRNTGVGFGKYLSGRDVTEQAVTAPDVIVADHGHTGEHHTELFGRCTRSENGLAARIALSHSAEALQQRLQLRRVDPAKQARAGQDNVHIFCSICCSDNRIVAFIMLSYAQKVKTAGWGPGRFLEREGIL